MGMCVASVRCDVNDAAACYSTVLSLFTLIAASSKQLEEIGKDETKLKDMVKRGEESERMPTERVMPARRAL